MFITISAMDMTASMKTDKQLFIETTVNSIYIICTDIQDRKSEFFHQ